MVSGIFPAAVPDEEDLGPAVLVHPPGVLDELAAGGARLRVGEQGGPDSDHHEAQGAEDERCGALADGLGGSEYVAREVIKEENIVDFTTREGLADRFAKRFGASVANTLAGSSIKLH